MIIFVPVLLNTSFFFKPPPSVKIMGPNKMATTAKNIQPIKVDAIRTRLAKMINARNEYAANIDEQHVYISAGNRKTGFAVPSISLIPVADCGNCSACSRLCYDLRNDCIYNGVTSTRAKNSAIAHTAIDRYFFEIKIACKAFRFFRWHIGGDILSAAYLAGMIDVALACPHCTFLAFTKRFDLVNEYVANGGEIPSNFQLIFSAWPGMALDNPYNFPVSSPLFVDGSHAAGNDPISCPGDCSNCAMMGGGCWTLKHGQGVVFAAH